MSRTVIVDDPVIASLLPRVSRAAALAHSGRSFLEHLLCTWRILADWRMPVAVCRAGFMHSAYSTSFYPHALFRLDERETVRRLIGREAEDLVFRFCTMDRPDFWDGLVQNRGVGTLTYPDRLRAGARVRVARKTLGNLLIMESANIAEQSRAADAGPAPWMSRVTGWWAFLDDRSTPLRSKVRPSLTERADEGAIEAYRLALKAPVRKAIPLLERAIDQNPWAAEPRILRALCALDAGDAGAVAQATRGAELISAWAVAWDKRLSVQAWKALADRIRSPRSSSQRDFRSFSAMLRDRAPRPRSMRV